MVRFDAYTATTQALTPDQVLPWFFDAGGGGLMGGNTVHQGKGFHTFKERIAVRDGSGSEVGSIAYGGRQGDRIMVEVKGEATPHIVERLRSDFWHRVTRVDACADFDAGPDAIRSRAASEAGRCHAVQSLAQLHWRNAGYLWPV